MLKGFFVADYVVHHRYFRIEIRCSTSQIKQHQSMKRSCVRMVFIYGRAVTGPQRPFTHTFSGGAILEIIGKNAKCLSVLSADVAALSRIRI